MRVNRGVTIKIIADALLLASAKKTFTTMELAAQSDITQERARRLLSKMVENRLLNRKFTLNENRVKMALYSKGSHILFKIK